MRRNMGVKRRRAKWLANIKRDGFNPTKHHRVCSEHFINGEPARLYDEKNPDWAPTLNMGHESAAVGDSSGHRMNMASIPSVEYVPKGGIEVNWYISALTQELYKQCEQNMLCDITITIGQRKFFAHKAVLSVASPYFKKMFTSGFQESSSREVTIDGNSDAFESLLKFAYTGKLGISHTTLVDILCMACYMQFDKAVKLCDDYVKDKFGNNSLPLDVVWALVQHAENLPETRINKSARAYLKLNFCKFSQMDLFLEPQAAEFVLECLGNVDVLVEFESEEQIVKAMLRWMRHDWDQRKKHAANLLKLVPLGLVPLEYLKELCDGDDIPGCKTMLTDAKQNVETNAGVNYLKLAKEYPLLYAWDLTTAAIQTWASRSGYYDTNEKSWLEFTFEAPTVQGILKADNTPIKKTRKHTMIVLGEDLYAAGGLVGDTKTNNFCRYNSVTNEWEALNRMKKARFKCALVELDGYVYAIGGHNEVSVERYNILKGKWSKRNEVSPMLINVGCISAVAYKGCILLCGKEHSQPDPELCQVQIYLPWSNTWYKHVLKLSDLAVSTSLACSAFPPLLMVHRGKCYLVAQIYVRYPSHEYCERRPYVNQLNINLEADRPSVTPGESVPQDCIPKSNCGAFVINDEVFVTANGYIHNTGILATNDGKCVDLYDQYLGWNGNCNNSRFRLSDVESMVLYTFDRLRFRKKRFSCIAEWMLY